MHPRTKKPVEPIVKELRARRIANGISQHELAQRIGYDNSMVSYWETGLYRPKKESLECWCIGLGIKPS